MSLRPKPLSDREKRLRQQLADSRANITTLTRQQDKAMAVVEAARAYRKAETDGTPRMFRGKALQDLADVLDDALAVFDPESAGEDNA